MLLTKWANTPNPLSRDGQLMNRGAGDANPLKDRIASYIDGGGQNGALTFGRSDLSLSTADNRPARIFIVEDDPVMRGMVADYLEQHNIRAVLRRQEAGRAVTSRDAERGRCKFGGWQLERRTRRLTDPNGTEVALTKGEYALLTAFLDAPQRPLSREHLLQATRGHEDIFDRSIDVQILRLRRKLETDPSAPNIIRTERGIGYVFALPVERV